MILLLLTWLSMASDHEAFLDWAERPAAAETIANRTKDGRRPSTRPLEQAPTSESAQHRVRPGYRFAERLFHEAALAVQTRPGRVSPERIGTSYDGRPIWAFHLKNPGETPKRKVLIIAGLHALEWVGTEVAAELLTDLAEHPLPTGVQVSIVLLANPDGRAKVEGDIADDTFRYRRGNARGVDLNRDWGVNREPRAFWRKILPAYYGTSPSALSQPETRALDRLAKAQGYSRAASLHSFGGFFYTPWSGRFARLPKPDRTEFWQLGRAMEHAWGTRAYRTRQLGRWGFFFRAHGSEIDHLYGTYGTRAFLIEVTRSGANPLKPKTWTANFQAYNPPQPRRSRKHIERTVKSLKALIRFPELPSEQAAEHGRLPAPILGVEAP